MAHLERRNRARPAHFVFRVASFNVTNEIAKLPERLYRLYKRNNQILHNTIALSGKYATAASAVLFHKLEKFHFLPRLSYTFLSSSFHTGNLHCVIKFIARCQASLVTPLSPLGEQNVIDVFTITNHGVSDNLPMRRRRTKAPGGEERKRERERKTPGA